MCQSANRVPLGDLSLSVSCIMSNVTQSVFGKMKAIQCCDSAQIRRSWVQLHDTCYDADNALCKGFSHACLFNRAECRRHCPHSSKQPAIHHQHPNGKYAPCPSINASSLPAYATYRKEGSVRIEVKTSRCSWSTAGLHVVSHCTCCVRQSMQT